MTPNDKFLLLAMVAIIFAPVIAWAIEVAADMAFDIFDFITNREA